MEYTVLKPLAHNGRLYKPGEKLTDLPEKAKLDRWVQNRVVSRGTAGGEDAAPSASTTPPAIPPTKQQTPPVIPPATQQTLLQDPLLDRSRAELDAMLLALGQTEAQVKALKNKNKAAVVELIRTLEKKNVAAGSGEGTGSAADEESEADGETDPGNGSAGEGGEADDKVSGDSGE